MGGCDEWPGSILCPIVDDDDQFQDWQNMNVTRSQIVRYSNKSKG